MASTESLVHAAVSSDSRGPSSQTVAVIGAGPAGLAGVKYLRHEGFKVTAFERRGDVGGIWTFSDDPNVTSTTKTTVSQLSKYIACMTDYPFPDDSPLYLNSGQWSNYYKSYAKHFDLYPHIEFNVWIETIKRDEAAAKWAVYLRGEKEPRLFDKVLVTTGSECVPIYPEIEGLDMFEGRFLHSQAFKDAADFKGKNVMVIGIGASAGDTCVDLAAEASKVYFSHRRGTKVLPRCDKNGPIDSVLTMRFSRLTNFLEHYVPDVYGLVVDFVFRKTVRENWGTLDPAWGLEPSPSSKYGAGAILINDRIVGHLRSGEVESVKGVRRVVGARSVELADGRILDDVDAIVACTGYKTPITLVEDFPHTTLDPKVGPLPDLYHNMFPVAGPAADSLVFVNYCAVAENAATMREVQCMAAAQVWAGKSTLPAPKEMQADAAAYQRWFTKRKLEWASTPFGEGRAHTLVPFVHRMAGTGVDEYLGWGWKGWKLWWNDRKLYNMGAWGLYSPHLYRIFETGKRPVWDGAREALERINDLFQKDWGKNGRLKKVK